MSELPIGTRVTYVDEDPNAPEAVGVISEPTPEELAYAKAYADPVGPEHGDVIVRWDDDDAGCDRSWERPGDLQVLPRESEYDELVSVAALYDLAARYPARMEVGTDAFDALRRMARRQPGWPSDLAVPTMVLGIPVAQSAELGSLDWQIFDRDDVLIDRGTFS